MLRVAAVLAGSICVLAVGPVASIRWVDPPTSAFMLRERFDGTCPAIDRRWVDFDQISPWVPIAIVASEDQRFPDHFGFDVDAIAEVLSDSGPDGPRRGASTISQQTAKNLFLWPGRSWPRKILEAAITLVIEATWPKRRILEVYMNVAEMAPCVYGVGAAARRHFGRPASDLDLWQASALAAILPNPKRLRVVPPSRHVVERAEWIRAQVRHLGGPAYLPAS